MPKPLRYLFIVLALFGLGFAIWTGIPGRPRAAEEGAAPQAAGAEAAHGRSEAQQASRESVETATEADVVRFDGASAIAVGSKYPESGETGAAQVTTRFVDKLGSPWPGVTLFDSKRNGVSATSDANGRVALDVPQPSSQASWYAELIARRRGCASKQLTCALTVGSTATLDDVILWPGVDVYGRTVDETGVGISVRVGESHWDLDTADRSLRFQREQLEFGSSLAVTSDKQGEFRLEGVSTGDLRLWARGEGTRTVWSETYTLVEGVDLHDVVLVVPRLRDDEQIVGVVLTPDGRPVRNARVSYAFIGEGRSGSTWVSAGEDGRFSISVEPGSTAYHLNASDLEQHYSDASLRDVRPGTRDVELRLQEPQAFCVVLRGPSDEPVETCSIRVLRETVPGAWMSTTATTRSMGRGRHELVAPTTRFRLEIESEGYRRYKSAELDAPTPGSSFEIQLVPPDLLRGRVFAEGRPAAGVKVSSFKDASGQTFEVNGFRSVHLPKRESEVTTNNEGTFELPCNDEDPLWIRAELAGFAGAEMGPVAPSGSSALSFDLVRGGAIEGVVILPGGAEAEGTIVAISRCDGFPRTQRAGSGGRFRFEGLAPGPWQVLQRDEEINMPPSGRTSIRDRATPIEWSCEVRDGRTTRFDLDLSRP
jgi:hypothetical protein